MLDAIQDFFDRHISSARDETKTQRAQRGYQLATAALLFEVCRADHDVKRVERAAVEAAVREAFTLNAQQTTELVRLAELQAEQSTSLYEFTRLINDHFSPAEKQHVIELLWEVAYADDDLDKYEEYIVRKIAELIHVPHRAFIRAKHRVQRKHSST